MLNPCIIPSRCAGAARPQYVRHRLSRLALKLTILKLTPSPPSSADNPPAPGTDPPPPPPPSADNSTLYADDPAAGAGGRARLGAASTNGDGGDGSDTVSVAGFPLPLDPVFLLVLAIAGVTALIMAGMAVYGCCHCRRARQRAAQRKVSVRRTGMPRTYVYRGEEMVTGNCGTAAVTVPKRTENQ